VGQSFAESLSQAATDIREKCDEYTKRHWNCGRSADTLATLFALQDTITCDASAREARSGGTGLQDVLDFIQLLVDSEAGAQNARVTILSGKSCISLKAPYLTGQRRGGGAMPRLLWCNAENSSDFPPDPSIAYDLTEHFAGTLVSIAFTLDPEYLARSVESDDGGHD